MTGSLGDISYRTAQLGVDQLAIPPSPPYVSPADGCESGFAAFGHPATAKTPSLKGTDIAGRHRSVRQGAAAPRAERPEPFKDIRRRRIFRQSKPVGDKETAAARSKVQPFKSRLRIMLKAQG